jgi:hypothetical protein
MSLTFAIIVGIAMGIVFGFALEKSRVFEPGIIVGQMQLRNFIMLKVFLTAVATGQSGSRCSAAGVKLQPSRGLCCGWRRTAARRRNIAVRRLSARRWRRSAPAIATLFTLVGRLVGAVTYSYAQPALSRHF